MPNSNKFDINQILLEAHKHSIERAIETAIPTDTSLVVAKNGKIIKIKPKYK